MKNNKVYLTQLASAAGCGAKIGPKVLAQVVEKTAKVYRPHASGRAGDFR